MGTATLILGESGTGKSTSMRNINPEEAILIKPIGKPLPFKSKDWLAWDARAKKGTVVTTDKWDVIVAVIKRAHEYGKRIVIVDDFQYVMSNEFMRRSEEKSFDKFTEIGRTHRRNPYGACENEDYRQNAGRENHCRRHVYYSSSHPYPR